MTRYSPRAVVAVVRGAGLNTSAHRLATIVNAGSTYVQVTQVDSYVVGQEFYPREQMTPEALRALQKADIERWWPIIKSANIKGE